MILSFPISDYSGIVFTAFDNRSHVGNGEGTGNKNPRPHPIPVQGNKESTGLKRLSTNAHPIQNLTLLRWLSALLF